ncbi:MAG TPA: SGNH/GDSL hydrolase family protein [Bacteroidota bacterium]|nr:SGNH/GDSL hydrolase family protein [Bacteroidota bacterium]
MNNTPATKSFPPFHLSVIPLFPHSLIPSSLAFVLFLLIGVSCKGIAGDKPDSGEVWVGTWGTAPQLVEPGNMPPKPGLNNSTLRQIVCVSIGGNRLRFRFSNEFSGSPVTMKTVRVAASLGGSVIDTTTDRELSFGGRPEAVLAPQSAMTSDPIDFDLKPRMNVAITIFFDSTSPDVTGHPGSRTTSYILPGNGASSADLPGAVGTDHWYIINAIDVVAPDSAAAVVVLGNSITDGRGSGTNKQDRWPDELALRLQASPGMRRVAVLNMGIGGNCVLRNCLGPAAGSRFERDVISQHGVRWLIILEGINDIGQARGEEGSASVADGLIAEYKRMIDRAHAMGIRVYGATLLPFGGSFYDSPGHRAAWKKVNDWIRKGGCFDAVIDFDAALHDPADPSHLLPSGDTGDHLHPNEVGHKMMGDAVDLMLFK